MEEESLVISRNSAISSSLNRAEAEEDGASSSFLLSTSEYTGGRWLIYCLRLLRIVKEVKAAVTLDW